MHFTTELSCFNKLILSINIIVTLLINVCYYSNVTLLNINNLVNINYNNNVLFSYWGCFQCWFMVLHHWNTWADFWQYTHWINTVNKMILFCYSERSNCQWTSYSGKKKRKKHSGVDHWKARKQINWYERIISRMEREISGGI